MSSASASVAFASFMSCIVGSGLAASAAMGDISSSTDIRMHVGWTDERNMTVCPLTHACIDPSTAADGCRVCINHKDAPVGRQGGKKYIFIFCLSPNFMAILSYVLLL